MIVDYVRSCYSTEMVFRVGDDPVSVEWHFADPAAGLFPGWNAFASGNWDARKLYAGQLGEQPGNKPWKKGIPLGRGTALFGCTDVLSWFDTGIPAGEQTPVTGSDHVPLCCSAPPVDSCCGISGSLTLSFPAGQGCPCLQDVVIILTQTSANQWNGEAVVCGGQTIQFQLRCTGSGVNAYRLDAAFGLHGNIPDVAPNTSSCSPFVLNFNLGDWPVQGVDCDGGTSVKIEL